MYNYFAIISKPQAEREVFMISLKLNVQYIN